MPNIFSGDENQKDQVAPELGYTVTYTTHMLRARKIVIFKLKGVRMVRVLFFPGTLDFILNLYRISQKARYKPRRRPVIF